MQTDKFTLWCFTSLTKIKFVLIGDKNDKTGGQKIKKIYELFAEVTGKDPLYLVIYSSYYTIFIL